MPKTRKPVADYITFDQYQKMLKAETDPRMRLCARYMWTFMLRVSEAVGQSKSDVEQIMKYRAKRKKYVESILKDPKKLEEYMKYHKGKKPKIKHLWQGPLPGLRPSDIDFMSPKDAGLKCKHTLRIYRKHGKFEILPFNDAQLYLETQNLIALDKHKIEPNQRILPYERGDVLKSMQLHGLTVGGQTKIHPHALRRGGGVHMRSTGKMELEDLQAVYSHTNLSQTLAYIGIDKRTAFNRFAEAQSRK